MKILIAGSDFNAVLTAKYIKLQNSENDIYLTTDINCDDNSYTPVNIKENDISGICDFVKYNQIEFTIVTSQMAIINGIADEFKKENFPIFAPYSEAARITYFNSIAKKIMYKLKINTPKFGIFDRENLAIEYIRHAKYPLIIKNDFTLFERENNVYYTFSKAKHGIQKIFENNNEKIVIENYMDIEPVYVYFITDGYNALPLITIEKTSNADYTIITAPAKKISDNVIINILKRAIYPLLDDITKYTNVYTGIIGLKIQLIKDTFYVLEFYNKFQEFDLQIFLSLLDDDLLSILYNTANNCMSDNYNYIKTDNNFSYTIAINKREINKYQNGDEDFIESEYKEKIIYTAKSPTLNAAKENLLDYLKEICNQKTYNAIINTINSGERRF